MNQRSVSVLLFYTADAKVLLQDRKTVSKLGEEWGFFGGKIEAGETPEQALVREIKEELDYDLDSYEPLVKISYASNERAIEIHAFCTPLGDKQSKFTQLEGAGMRLFSMKEAKHLNMMSHDYIIIEALFRKLTGKWLSQL